MQLGLRNTLWALVLPAAITPWNMFIMRTYFQGLPEEMFEAATIDGANDLETLLRIVLPLSKPIFATLLLFTPWPTGTSGSTPSCSSMTTTSSPFS